MPNQNWRNRTTKRQILLFPSAIIHMDRQSGHQTCRAKADNAWPPNHK